MVKNFVEILTERHDAYMSQLMKRLKEIRASDGKDGALCILLIHEVQGDPMLTDFDFELLKAYVENEKYHVIKAN